MTEQHQFFSARLTHVLSHGVFPAWTASCEFLLFCLCGHVWDVKGIWTKFLAANEIGDKRSPVLRCVFCQIWKPEKIWEDLRRCQEIWLHTQKTHQSMTFLRKFSWGLRNHHGQASLGILHHIFIRHGVLESRVVSLPIWLDFKSSKLFCFKSETQRKFLQTMLDQEHWDFF